KLKRLKQICKKNNDFVKHAFHLLKLQLKEEHAEVRYSTFQIIGELFVRSHLFRTLLLDQFQEFMDLTMETDFENPLPPPKQVAEKLKLESLAAVKEWNAKYGVAYKKLQLGFDFLKGVKKINFDRPQPVPAQVQQVAEVQLSRKKIIAGQRLDKLEKEMEKTMWEVVNCSVEIKSCLDLLIPTFNNDENNKEPENTDSVTPRDTGLFDRDYKIELNLNEVSSVKVMETTDNVPILERAKDCHRSANRLFIPRVKRWLATAVKYGAPQETVKQLIDIKLELERTVEKYKEVHLLKDSTADGSDSDCDDFEEVPTAQCFVEPLPILQPQPSTSHKQTSNKEDDTTTKKKPLNKIMKKIKSEPGVKKDAAKSLLEGAPVVPYGRDLLVWDKEKMDELRETVKMGTAQEYDVGHRFWTGTSASEGDSGISDAALNSITSRTIEFSGDFKPVTRSCKAPLPNGKLCPRQDRYKCPFHGKIIDRDACGVPVGGNPDQPSTSAAVDNSWQDSDFLRDLESNLPGNVKLGSKKDGKKKGKKRDLNGLSDLNASKNTSRSRLVKKVFNPSSIKRVSEKLDSLDAKRNFDKFGNNFNYALN
uniref:UV-stimulated scaffold protein A n=1 Tax=Ciona intestinalis TaxID=7719 RepID=F6RZ45_CIOIN